ncbi:hypothetical protein GGI11_003175 [Coemansia sp. RSA 2049]|nr:hypothetical protein GGI11_003175 [Coemansia sp. RSA 2049]KAJ2517929.1 hypothetical protein H4217_003653 [Coemansia sp. RSA 1939]KAJ2610526.1 hypothetical protein EV177_003919 [Coemansia sp. RSA 1804]
MRPELKPPPQHSVPVRNTKGQSPEHHQCSTTLLHQNIADIVQRAKDLTEQKWNSKTEAEALSLLAECEKAVSSDRYYSFYNSNSTSSATTDDRLTVSVFQAADRLGRKLVSSTDPYVPVALFVRYLEFYARLARPDITQRTLVNSRWWRWTQTPASVYSAQQLALLRFSIDKATVSASASSYSNYLRKTALPPSSTDLKALADLVDSRLADYRSAEDVTNDVVHRYRMLRLLIKVVEYTVFVTLVLIVGKWLLAENAVLFATTDIVGRMTIVATTVSLLALAFHVLLRYSMVGSLITPPPPINALSSARSWWSRFLLRGRWFRGPAAASRISLENDLRAREILRTAFPAAPAIDATAELRELLKSPSSNPLVPPRMSWQLRLALGWSRFARLFAVVEPMFVGEHGLSQRLALMWLRNLVQTVPPHHPNFSSPADASADAVATDVISGELQRFALFVKRNFESTPFALAADDLQAVSAFVAAHADPAAMEAFLELFTGGYVGLRHGSKSGNIPAVSDRLDYMINFAMEPISRAGQSLQASGFERSKPADIQKCTKSAVVMSFGTVISQLCWRHAHQQQQQQQQQQAGPAALVVAVNAFLETPDIPVSAALYRSAFAAAADVLRDRRMLRSLAASFEQRFLDGDQYVLRIVRRAHTPQSVGWKLPSVAPPTDLGAQKNPLVDCVSPYVAYLAQEEVEVAAGSDALVDPLPQEAGSVAKTDSVADFVERWSSLGILDTKSCVQCLSTAIRSVATPRANGKHLLLASTAEQWVLLGFRAVDSALSAKEPVSPLGRENVMQTFYQFLELALRASTATEASTSQHSQRCDVCACVYTKWKELATRYPIVATHATASFNSLLIRVLSGNHSQQSQSRERVRWALEVLDLMHGLGQTPTLQALDALCLAASRVRIDVSHQIDYWTHSIKTKARTRDTKMNRFAKSLF